MAQNAEEFEETKPLLNGEDAQVKTYHDFASKVKPLSHLKVYRPSGDYYHHFIVLNYNSNGEKSKVTVLHYRPSTKTCFDDLCSIVEVGDETFELSPDVSNSLFDYPNLHFVESESGYPKTEQNEGKVICRILERFGETAYDVTSNNCENLVNYILTGRNEGQQAGKKRRKADCSNLFLSFKEVGFATTLFVALFGALSGSMVRHAYVKLITASVIIFDAHISNCTVKSCPNRFGTNIINEALIRMHDVKYLPIWTSIPNATSIMEANEKKLYNIYVCDTAKEGAIKTLIVSIITSIVIETVVMLFNLWFNVLSLRAKGILEKEPFCRIIFIKIVRGFIPTAGAIGLGYATMLYCSRPSVAFFFTTLGAGILLRFLITLLFGWLFDKICCKYCWEKCCRDSSVVHEQKNSCCCSCWLFIFITVLIIGMIATSVIFVFDEELYINIMMYL